MAMRSCLVLNLLIFFYTTISYGQTRDPWILSDERFKSEGLCDSFPNGTQQKITHSSWSQFGRDEWSYEVQITCSIDAGGQKLASIVNIKNGSVFSTSMIKESDWNSYRGNLLRQKAIATESFGMKFTLNSVQDLPQAQLRFQYSVHSSTGVLVETGHWILAHGPVLQMIVERYSKKLSLIVEESLDVLIP